MVSHMKTTIEIADPLFEEARMLATEEGTTLRSLVEDGLRRLIEARRQSQPFRLRRVTFGGDGLQPGMEHATWEQIRERAYEGRGT